MTVNAGFRDEARTMSGLSPVARMERPMRVFRNASSSTPARMVTVDINSGTGIVVIGLACLIIGETVLGRRTVYKGILAALVGSVVYRFIYAVVFYTKVVPELMSTVF